MQEEKVVSEATYKKRNILAVVILVFLIAGIAGGIVLNKMSLKYSEEKMREEMISYLQPQIDSIKQSFGFSDVQVEFDLSSITVEAERTSRSSKGLLKGYALCYFIIPEINEILESGNVTYQDYITLQEIESGIKTFNFESEYYYNVSIWDSIMFKDSQGNVYDTFRYCQQDGGGTYRLEKNYSETLIEHTEPKKYKGGSSSSGGKCPSCNGTGYVRYYYGSSDLEAYLSGHDPYTTGKCTMCKGTGK